MRTFVGWLALLLALGLLSGGCSPRAVVMETVDAARHPTPTAITLREYAPGPTRTPTIPAPTATPNTDPDFYDGGLVISFDQVGQQVQLRREQSFLLNLGKEYAWQVTIDPADVITQNMKITPEVGEQGVYIARRSGTASLRAVGQPGCRAAQPPCSRPDVIFQVMFVVK